MMRDTPNFTYEQELACPACGAMLKKRYMRDRRGRYKRVYPAVTRPEYRGPWAKDDVLATATEQISEYEKRKAGRVWIHVASLECSKCGTVMSRGQAIAHDFTDAELPFDFWDVPDGVYLPEDPQQNPNPLKNDLGVA